MTLSLVTGGISFYDAPGEVEGSPYRVAPWTDVNGYKMILQVNPSIDKSAHLSKYIAKAKSSEEKSHKAFLRDFGGKVFAVMPVSGTVPADVELRMIAERELL